MKHFYDLVMSDFHRSSNNVPSFDSIFKTVLEMILGKLNNGQKLGNHQGKEKHKLCLFMYKSIRGFW